MSIYFSPSLSFLLDIGGEMCICEKRLDIVMEYTLYTVVITTHSKPALTLAVYVTEDNFNTPRYPPL